MLSHQRLDLNPKGENTNLMYFYILYKWQGGNFGPSLSRQQLQNQAAFPGKEPKASPVSGMLTQALLALIRASPDPLACGEGI